MQIPILNGIYTNENADFRTSYPRNLIPVPKNQGISSGYLRPSDGIVQNGTGPGTDKGGINWNDRLYRIMGAELVEIGPDGSTTSHGAVASGDKVTFDYSFDRLGVSVGLNLYYWDGSTLQQVTDSDLGDVIDFIWVDGYFMTTDGEFLVVTELGDPFTVLPFKFGSSEADPDPIKAVKKIRNEPYAINRFSVEVFNNIGGASFPFQRIEGAQITRGTVGTKTCCVFIDTLAFLGGGRNEAIAVWLGGGGSSTKISSREIDQILKNYSEATLANGLMEPRIDDGHQFLYLHLPDKTLVYDAAASRSVGEPVWFILTSGLSNSSEYLARNLIRVYDNWHVGNPENNKIGYLSNELSSHWGDKITWELSTSIIYNGGNGAIFHEIELVCLSGRVELGDDPKIATSYSLDGETWSQPRYINAGKRGERKKRLVWLQQGTMRNWRIQKFSGDSDSFLTMARLEATTEPMVV